MNRNKFQGLKQAVQRGFTLVELAIVLVIAGLILTAVLKGTDAVNKAKVERMVADLKGLQSTILEFQKRNNRLPGDCNNDGLIGYNFADTIVSKAKAAGIAAAKLPDNLVANRTAAFVDSTSDTSVMGICNSTESTEANVNLMWNELRRAGVVDSQRLNWELASHVMDDLYLVGNVADGATGSSIRTNVIVAYGIPVWMAEAIDAEIDGVAHFYGSSSSTTGTGTSAVTVTSGPANTGRVRIWNTTAVTSGTPPTMTAAAGAATYGANRDDLVSISFQFDPRKLNN